MENKEMDIMQKTYTQTLEKYIALLEERVFYQEQLIDTQNKIIENSQNLKEDFASFCSILQEKNIDVMDILEDTLLMKSFDYNNVEDQLESHKSNKYNISQRYTDKWYEIYRILENNRLYEKVFGISKKDEKYYELLFKSNYHFFFPRLKLTKVKIKDKHFPDGWFTDDKSNNIPLEVKLHEFNEKALKQLQRYMNKYNCVEGIAVGSKLTVELPNNIRFISLEEIVKVDKENRKYYDKFNNEIYSMNFSVKDKKFDILYINNDLYLDEKELFSIIGYTDSFSKYIDSVGIMNIEFVKNNRNETNDYNKVYIIPIEKAIKEIKSCLFTTTEDIRNEFIKVLVEQVNQLTVG